MASYLSKEGLTYLWGKLKTYIGGKVGNSKLFYGTCSTAAATAVKDVVCDDFTADDLVAGVMINVSFSATNSAAIANLQLNVNGTGAKGIKYIYNGTRSNIPAASYLTAGQMYTFYYDGTYWIVQMIYNTNTTTCYGYFDYYFRPYAGSAIYRYKICGLGEDNRLYPITTTNQTSVTQVAKAVQTAGLRPGHLWVHYTSNTISAGAATTAACLVAGGGACTVAAYSFNATIPTYRTIYLRGTYDKDKDLFYLYDDGASGTTSYYTVVPTNTANITLSDYFVAGYYYMLVGGTYSTADYFAIFADNPLYYFDGENLIPVSTKVAKDIEAEIPTKTSDLTNDSGFLTSAPVSSVNSKTGAVSLTYSDVGAASSSHTHSGYVPTGRTVNGKALSANITLDADDVGALPDSTTIPTKTSDLTNDSGFLTSHQDISGKLNTNGNGSDVTVAFTQASSRTNIATGSTLATAFSQISKWFADLGTMAFKSSVAKTDLDSGVQASLDLADSALQSYTETDPTVPSWAKASSKPTYTASEVGAVPTTRKVNNKALSADISLTYSDVGAAASSHGTHVTYSTTNPVIDGTASPGSASTVARSDHKHPTDTTRAAKTTVTTYTLTASGWSGSTYSGLQTTYPSASYDIEIEPNGDSCTEAQLSAWSAAKMVGSATTNVLKAVGTVPTVDIPIIVKYTPKS